MLIKKILLVLLVITVVHVVLAVIPWVECKPIATMSIDFELIAFWLKLYSFSVPLAVLPFLLIEISGLVLCYDMLRKGLRETPFFIASFSLITQAVTVVYINIYNMVSRVVASTGPVFATDEGVLLIKNHNLSIIPSIYLLYGLTVASYGCVLISVLYIIWKDIDIRWSSKPVKWVIRYILIILIVISVIRISIVQVDTLKDPLNIKSGNNNIMVTISESYEIINATAKIDGHTMTSLLEGREIYFHYPYDVIRDCYLSGKCVYNGFIEVGLELNDYPLKFVSNRLFFNVQVEEPRFMFKIMNDELTVKLDCDCPSEVIQGVKINWFSYADTGRTFAQQVIKTEPPYTFKVLGNEAQVIIYYSYMGENRTYAKIIVLD